MTVSSRSAVTVLMLAPLIAGTSSTGVALFLGLVSAIVLLVSTTVLLVLQRLIAPQSEAVDGAAKSNASLNFPLLMLVLSVTTSLLILVLQRWFYAATLITGIWLPLISANLLLVRQLMAVEGRDSVLKLTMQSLQMGAIIVLAFTGLALCRELLGHGHILGNMHLFTDAIPAHGIEVLPNWPRLKLFEMAPGALLLLAVLLALHRQWQLRHPAPPAGSGTPEPDRRVRVTGKIS